MKNINHKLKIPTIVLTVILAFTTISLGISTVIAQEYPTACFLAAEPSPVGLGQYVTISVMVQPVPPTSTDVYHDVELKITKPNGEIETYTRDTFTHGAYYIQYTPDMIGTYNLQMNYPGEYFASLDQTRAASISPVVELVVQADPIPSWPEIPPTDDFWTRPINADLREWSSISGNWLQNGYNTTYRMGRTPCAYNPYTPSRKDTRKTKDSALRVFYN